ncbi:MAG: hypothetical protein QNI91_10740 [Arenicellales bacterium]|nr:hypothetical protein [Arenicellales bacterium]
MSDEVLELSWFLTDEDKLANVEAPSCKAHFCLKFGTEIIEHKVFTKDELLNEIRRLRDIGERPIEYEEALQEIYSVEQAG